MRNIPIGIAAAVLLGSALACAGDGTGLDVNGNPKGSGAECTAPAAGQCTDGTCFTRDIQPILSDNCAVSGCHAGTAPQLGQNLSAGVAYANIVCVPSVELPGMVRVRPFQPDFSYLVRKIQGTQADVGGSGGRMPLGGTPLTQTQIDLIRAWITAGAKNN